MIIQRRSFIAGLGSLIAAPAIVRAASLMPVRAIMVDAVENITGAELWLPKTAWVIQWQETASYVRNNIITYGSGAYLVTANTVEHVPVNSLSFVRR